MAKSDNLNDFLTGLADTFRNVLGLEEKMSPQSFEDRVRDVYDLGFASGGPAAESITATAEQVVSGKTFGAGGQEIRTGTMPLRESGQAANSCQLREGTLYYRLPHGYWPNTYSNAECEAGMGQAAVAEAIGLTAEKLVAGETVLGIEGSTGKDAAVFYIGPMGSGQYQGGNPQSVEFTCPYDGKVRVVAGIATNSDRGGSFSYLQIGSNVLISSSTTWGKGASWEADAKKGETVKLTVENYHGQGGGNYVVAICYAPGSVL